MACQGAPAVRAILSQASALWPNRNKASDGVCASQQHSSQNPSSDHEPDARGLAHAADLTHDPAHGCDAHAESDRQVKRRDRRIKYRISKRRITSYYAVGSYPPWADRPYHGSNPHDKHAHTSVRREYENDTSPWYEEVDELAGVGEQILAEVQTVAAEVAKVKGEVAEIQAVVGAKTYAPGQTIIKALISREPVDPDKPDGPTMPKEHLEVVADMLSELLNRQAEMEERLARIEEKLQAGNGG